jgi:hypothetical protein
MRAKHEQAIREHFKAVIPAEIRTLASQANHDLYAGPLEEDGYPGFSKACHLVGDWAYANVGTLWFDCQAEMVLEWPEEDAEVTDIVEFERKDILRALFGSELVRYL